MTETLETAAEMTLLAHDAILKFSYQRLATGKPNVTEDVKGLLGKLLSNVSFEHNDFKARYHGRIYQGTIYESSSLVDKSGTGSPTHVCEGTIVLNLHFPNRNSSNARLVRRLQREIPKVIPYEKQSPWM